MYPPKFKKSIAISIRNSEILYSTYGTIFIRKKHLSIEYAYNILGFGDVVTLKYFWVTFPKSTYYCMK